MIILHCQDVELWFEPNHIVLVAAADVEGCGAEVFSVDGGKSQGVRETPAEIARLKYAWSRRNEFGPDLSENYRTALELVDGVITGRRADLSIDEDR